MVSHEDRKIHRLEKIKRTILAAEAEGTTLDEDMFVSACIMDWGSSRRTILDYIKTARESIAWDKR